MVVFIVTNINASSRNAFKPISSTIKGILNDILEIGDTGWVLVF